MKRFIILVVVLIGFILNSNAQGNFGVHIGAAFPLGDFANDNSDYGGGAATGLDVGVKYFYPLTSNKDLSVTLGVDYLNNGLDQTYKENMKQSLNGTVFNLAIKKFPVYINIPVLAGLDYRHSIDHNLALFADAAVGANCFTPTDLVFTLNVLGIASKDITLSSKSLILPTCQVGGGVLINNKYTVGVHYNYLGFRTIQKSGLTVDDQPADTGSLMKVNLGELMFAVGIRF
jgi:hypothetical protein